ncbi:MAG TPA: hypothetical protein VG818_13950 [Gemmatimonadaceae bacterium]|nr:hypothetical protein [Gemmatimonadaceae bacterium]
MKPAIFRLLALGAGIAVILSCDAASPTAPTTGTGGSHNTGGGKDNVAPTVSIDTPATGALVNVGDSILVTMRLHDDRALAGVAITGFKETGDVNLGTFQRTIRYSEIDAPGSGLLFRSGLRDTVIRRYLQPAQPVDTSLDSLVILALVKDSAGNVDSVLRRVNIVAGPKVNVVAPAPGDSVPAGFGMTVTLHATHGSGVAKLSFRVQGETNWPTKLDTSVTATYPPNSRDVTLTSIVRIPLDAPVRGKITVTSSAVDVNGQPGGAAPVVAIVRSGSNLEPKVFQTVQPRSETTDSVAISASGDGIQMLGFVAVDSVGNILRTDSLALQTPYTSNARGSLSLNLAPSTQGTKVFIYSFAKDQSGRVGYSIPTGTAIPQGVASQAHTDSTLVVYGHTFVLPRPGTVADIAVDPLRGNIFLSNTSNNLLEVWQNGKKQFSSKGIAVGALPWGLNVSISPDTLLVANSGGTNISRVYIGSPDPSGDAEDLAHRILTRNTFVYVVHETTDPKTGVSREAFEGPYSYSDRPQYVVQGASGNIYYSTRPTVSAPTGTIRMLDPTQAVPDPRQIFEYGTRAADQNQFVIFNIDDLSVLKAADGSSASDSIFMCDHKPGTSNAAACVADTTVAGVVAKLRSDPNILSDVRVAQGLDVNSLALKDTTFAAISGDRRWVGFGEGATGNGTGRVIMANDLGPSQYAASGSIPVADLIENASDKVNGIAVDSTGQLVAARGLGDAYIAAVQQPFHLRLQGTYDSQGNGTGVAFGPGANGNATPANDRVAFVGSSTGTIEIVDAAYYTNRGTLQVKYGLYGPIRASRPLPGDPPDVVMKLFGMTPQGLVVVDLRASDIKSAP